MSTEMKHKTSNPCPLGLLGFGMTTVLLNLHNAGFSPEQDPANPAESHMWNLLQTDDGPTYVDLTWYDSREPDTYNSYRDGWLVIL